MNGNRRILLSMALSVVLMMASTSPSNAAFMSSSRVSSGSLSTSKPIRQVQSNFMGRSMKLSPIPTQKKSSNTRKGTELGMFLGSDGGILGVGTPEVAVIALVGYFILGPTELFKLTKEIGKFIQNIRTLGSEASKSFETTMEDQLQIQEIRKAQSELNDAFNFRRSINVDGEGDAFSTMPKTAAAEEIAGATATAATATAVVEEGTKKKKRRRRVKKKKVVEDVPGEIPDLDMSAAFQDEFKDQMGIKSNDIPPAASTQTSVVDETEEELRKRLRAERLQRLEDAQKRSEEKQQAQTSGTAPFPEPQNAESDWFKASDSDVASEVLAQQQSAEEAAAAQSRFAAQLSGDWNQQVMANEDALSPLGAIMDRLAILEEERKAANLRLDAEFQQRAELEEKFYREKRKVLEDAAADVSAEAYGNFDFGTDKKKTDESKKVETKAAVNGDKKE